MLGFVTRIRSYLARKTSYALISPQDVFLVSYPKSGNTWARFLFANLLKSDPNELITFQNVHDYCPELIRNDDLIRRMTPPRLIKSHEPFNPLFPKVIYLVRDGRDAYVSYYHHLKRHLPAGMTFAEFLDRHELPYGRWSDHARSWISHLGGRPDRFLLIRYEDMLEDTLSSLRKAVEFAGLKVEDGRMEQAVQASTFSRMEEVEERYGGKYSDQRPEKFMRKGITGDWVNHFTPAEIRIFREREDVELLKDLGYAAF